MATLPRMNHWKHRNNISTPFSTSPRQLQEMTFPSSEGDGHDVTAASGMSMKQYQEQLTSLRSDNFQMKLRIFFLEEKIGNGAPPAVKGLLLHNVRLQVEIEELKRQLSEKQELLAAAAEAIDVLEHQGSSLAEGGETSMNNSVSITKEMNEDLKCSDDRRDAADDTYPESESAGEYLAVTVNNNDLDQLTKLRKENYKALQMIKGCMKRIQQQDIEIKKLKSNKESAYEHVSDSQLEKYEEILKWKDEHIRDLENKLKEIPRHVENTQNEDVSGNLQQLLTKRLQGLTYFLDKLLSHKCVLGEDKKKLAESILEQSLALPVGLKLDETMALEDFSLDESNIDSTQSLRLDDLTMMFGHHLTCHDESKGYSTRQLKSKIYPQADMLSESDCWSEPDRNVSLARVGLSNTGVTMEENASDNNGKLKSRRSRISYGSRTEDKIINESVFLEEIRELTNKNEQFEIEKKDLEKKLEEAMIRVNDLINDKDELTKALATERNNIIESNKNLEAMKTMVSTTERKLNESEQQLIYTIQLSETLRKEKQELELTYLENERSLRRAADEATVQASQAALERARAQHDRLQLERELEEVREELSAALEANGQLQIQLTQKVLEDNKIAEVQEVAHLAEERPMSPDQGIDSDRLSSLEQNDAITLSPRSLLQENIKLKAKLSRTNAALADTLTQLNAANMRKRNVQRAICREIHKTQGVLRKARDQLEHNC